MIAQIKSAASLNWLGVILGLLPSFISLALAVVAIPPRVLRTHDEFGQLIDHGNNDYAMDRPVEMVLPTIVGYGALLMLAFGLLVLGGRRRFALNMLVGLGAGIGVLAIGCFAQAFLDTRI